MGIKRLQINEEKLRDIHLRKIALGEIYGPMTGYPSIDKPWLKFYPEEYLKTNIPKRTIYRHLLEMSKDRMEDTALIYFDRKIKYKEMFEEIDRVAASLVEKGIKEGDVVTITLPTIPETIYLFYALNKIGAVINSIDPRTNESRIREFIKLSKSKMVFAIDKYAQKVEKAIIGTDIKEGFVVNPTESLNYFLKLIYKLKNLNFHKTKLKSWKKFLIHENNYKKVKEVEYKPNTPAGIIYTSGTTGVPKGAILSNDDLVAQSLNMKNAFFLEKNGEGLKFLNIMPPWLAYGLSCGMSSILCMGMQMDLIPLFDYKEFDEILVKHKPEVILGIPTFFEELMQSKKLDGVDLSFLKAVIVGGSPLNTGTEEKINKFFKEHKANIKITKGYGMTELSSVATYTSQDKCNLPGSVGIPLVYNNVKVVNPETKEESPYGVVGEIYLTGPTRMIGYLSNPEEDKKIFEKETGAVWVKSGDLGYITEDGIIYCNGRIKQMIIFEGHNVYPYYIENVLSQHPAVAKVAVIGVKDVNSINSDIPTAVIELKEEYKSRNSNLIIEELRKFSEIHLPLRDMAQQYIIIDDMPLNDNGKINKIYLTENIDEIKRAEQKSNFKLKKLIKKREAI